MLSGGATREYMAGMLYVNNNFEYLQTETGRVLSDYTYIHNIADHQGNVRVSFKNNNGTAQKVQEDHYYPFGLTMGQSNISGPENKKLYSNKEWKDQNGEQWYDFGFRNYDAALGRWFNPDPLAESLGTISPYNYCLNDPINLVDPLGLIPNRPSWWSDGMPTWGTLSSFLLAGFSYDEALALTTGIWQELALEGNIGLNDIKYNENGEAYYWVHFPSRSYCYNGEWIITAKSIRNYLTWAREAKYNAKGDGRYSFHKPKVWSMNDDEFWNIKPTYSNKSLWTEFIKRIFGSGGTGKKILKGIRKGRTLNLDPSEKYNEKLEFAITGRLRTLGVGHSIIIPIYDENRFKVGVTLILFYGFDGNDKEIWNIETNEGDFI